MRGRGEVIPPAVALTGGIGSGKSAVASYLRKKGVPVFDSDSAAKKLYDDDIIVSNLEHRLGCSLRTPEGLFDRKALADRIFSSPGDMAAVESVVHPAVLADFEDWRRTAVSEWGGYAGQPPFVVMESAIVLEKPLFDGVFDAVVLVDAPLEVCVARAARRDGASEEAVRLRASRQHFDMSRVDAVIINDCDLSTLRIRTDIAFKLLSLRQQ